MEWEVHKGKLPRAPDVKALRERFPEEDMVAGQLITYAEISSVIEEPVNSQRFRNVVSLWKQVVQENSDVELEAEVNSGYRVLDEIGKVTKVEKKRKRVLNQGNKMIRALRNTDRSKLPEQARQEYDHKSLVASNVRAFAMLETTKASRPRSLNSKENTNEKIQSQTHRPNPPSNA